MLDKTVSVYAAKSWCRPLTEIKSVWLVIVSEAGDAFCGVV